MPMFYLKRLLIILGILALTVVILLTVCDLVVTHNAKGKLYTDVRAVPHYDTALLLGTTPQTRIGRKPNQFFKHRIEATERLYKAGKIKHILISGDANSLDGVNEVEAMRDSLVARGIDTNDILLDGQGLSTIKSVKNAVNRYGLHSFIVISQKFHNERAIYLAEHLKLDTHDLAGYNAADATNKTAIITYVREYFARVKVFKDLMLD